MVQQASAAARQQLTKPLKSLLFTLPLPPLVCMFTWHDCADVLESEFIYVGYVGSKYLDEKVRSERTDFDISEN